MSYYWRESESEMTHTYRTMYSEDTWVWLHFVDREYEYDSFGDEYRVHTRQLPKEITTLEEAKAYIETMVRMGAL